MTWLKYEFSLDGGEVENVEKMRAIIRWAKNNLSSNGVLWKHTWVPNEWHIIYVAQEQDLLLLKLKFGE